MGTLIAIGLFAIPAIILVVVGFIFLRYVVAWIIRLTKGKEMFTGPAKFRRWGRPFQCPCNMPGRKDAGYDSGMIAGEMSRTNVGLNTTRRNLKVV